MPASLVADLEKVLALVILLDLGVRHDATVLSAAILVDIDDANGRLHLLLIRLEVLDPFDLALARRALPEDGVLPQRRVLDVALLDAEDELVAVVVGVRVAGLSGLEPCLGGLGLGVGDVDAEGLLGRFVGLGAAGHGVGARGEGGGLEGRLVDAVGSGECKGMWTYDGGDVGVRLREGGWGSEEGRCEGRDGEDGGEVHDGWY
jgi:hypothetical protein